MLGNLATKINHKLNALELYCRTEKLRGYELQITGDIDNPTEINKNSELLGEWIDLANKIGTVRPCLYVTASSPFTESVKTIFNIDPRTRIGSHGIKHTYYSKYAFADLETDLQLEAKNTNTHRFPYLDYNLMTLYCTSKYFDYDSSIVSGWMYPFKIGNMIEYPVCPPTDTALRNKPLTKSITEKYQGIIKEASKFDRPITFLLHPNPWSVQLLRDLTQ